MIFKSFSALQRAENSSMRWTSCYSVLAVQFQCSSASRKFLNDDGVANTRLVHQFQCSSASRKFLNPRTRAPKIQHVDEFQCSSASRKFLNRAINSALGALTGGFSALQRAENSSMLRLRVRLWSMASFSALQRAENSSMAVVAAEAVMV